MDFSEFLDREEDPQFIIEHYNNQHLFGFTKDDEDLQLSTIRERQTKKSSEEVSLDEIVLDNEKAKT